ncbi:hypothetical protein HO173_010726 [Letharia columbiana]|uniref:Cytochrome oxidase c assembly-domain-containing protein n=1 Tax=Letharia columbiana TaxID=112416 RepID=A0A8H6FM22_9LECA|nr:uncharacterized protein HO173_010726 [Letharia columbiana]KAF6231026.1 hypothetical protein HO173_010726 [Letharia columbiana]
MSRSAADATRFTATSPHAYARPTPINRPDPSTHSASGTPRPNPNAPLNPNPRVPPPPIDPKKGAQGSAPPGETAVEKVARLRQARLREREAQITTWDRVVIRGRVWADRAHKTTVVSLLGFSIVAAAITGFALTDMILHNRRKRSAFYAEQRAIYSQRLIEAIETEKSGMPLDEDQTLVINRERARVQAEEAAKERSWGKSIRGMLMGGLKGDEEEGERGEKVAVPSEEEILKKLGVTQTSILERAAQADRDSGPKTTDVGHGSEEGRRDGTGILQAVAEKRREGERAMEAAGVRGGPLDRMAEGPVQAVGGTIDAAEEKAGSRGGWSNWWAGK